ncbi:H-NS histone family protein [Paracoccus caeni]|uniref:H-NS histone family protein n=1 Tax=Paracoccus caeni TaxID=657651 RepID=A0A934SHS8_9RHOB|nr:H-NS histone family protein [Paracoccus caeni]MBK4214708.1 H-NS histone family protein [Paracoccus caeni]
MSDIDIETLDIGQLKRLRKELDKAIENYEVRQKAKAIIAAENAVKEFGLTLANLGVTAKTRKPVEVKYRNPEDATQTWTGRGRKPLWMEKALKAGKKLEDLSV